MCKSTLLGAQYVGAYLFELHAMQQQLKQLKAIAAPIDISAQTLALLADLPTPKQRKRWSWLDYSAAAASIFFWFANWQLAYVSRARAAIRTGSDAGAGG